MKRSDFIKTITLIPLLPSIDIPKQEQKEDDFGTFDECFDDNVEIDYTDDGEGNHGFAPNVKPRY